MSIFGKIMSAIFGSKDCAASDDPVQKADVAAILDKAAADSGDELEWRTSVVDLMKALKVDSSLNARRSLAKELGYTGATDSATMNVWLHQRLLIKLSAQ